MQFLFSYGTLQLESVQRQSFGRKLNGRADTLVGYSIDQVEITDPEVLAASGKTHHPIISHTGNQTDRIDGVIFEVSDAELAQADEYEVDDYRRVSATFTSGQQAWVYISADS